MENPSVRESIPLSIASANVDNRYYVRLPRDIVDTMAATLKRDEARVLRTRGESINVIAARTGVSKSTVSYWCRDIPLSRLQQKALAKRQASGSARGRLRAAERKRNERLASVRAAMARGAQDVKTLSERDTFILGLGLYWGEGYKNGNEECALTNSDPAIIQTFIRWMRSAYGIQQKDLILRVSVNETHRARVSIIEEYWSQITGVPLIQFTKTSLIRAKTKKQYANHEAHFGTLRVKIRRGTSLRRRIMGSLEALRKLHTH